MAWQRMLGTPLRPQVTSQRVSGTSTRRSYSPLSTSAASGITSCSCRTYDALWRIGRALDLYEEGLEALREPGVIDEQEAQERQKLLDTNSWNLGCGLLQSRSFLVDGSFMNMVLGLLQMGGSVGEAMRKPFID